VSEWIEAAAPAKLNLALVVGPLREDGRHDLVTVLERLSLADTIAVRRSAEMLVSGFDGDTLVRSALDALALVAEGEQRFEAQIDKQIPVAAGLGGGSSDAATALQLANELLDTPLAAEALGRIAASLGADVPFFLHPGAQLATGDGTTLEPIQLPRDYTVVLALPNGAAKASTDSVYAGFDARNGAHGFEERRAQLERALDRISTARDLGELPPNDLARSPFSDEMLRVGAFRADVSGAGPVVYGLVPDAAQAADAARTLEARAAVWVAEPA
jgi:4-diphosphocytidyl-2-C-methyl-D-erythritol kinase